MARRSPKEPTACQKYETGCTWRLYKIFNFRQGHARTRLVSSRRHLNKHVTGKGDSRRRLNVLTIDDKYPDIDVSIKRGRDGCQNISCVKNDQVADWRNRATEMIDHQNFINGKYLSKQGEGSHSNQLVDALQILYSNKELFLKLLQDPNSLLVKQIHDFPDSHVKKQCLARQKKVIKTADKSMFNQPQTYKEIQRGKPLKSLDTFQSTIDLEPQSSDKIVVLNPGPVKIQNFADSSSYNGQTVKSSHFPFAHLKRKLRHAIGGRKKEQQRRAIESVPHKFHCHDNQVIRLENVGGNSPSTVLSDIAKEGKSSRVLRKKDKTMKAKDFELSIRDRQDASESVGGDINVTLRSLSERNKLIFVAEARRNLSEILNCRMKECKQWTNTQGRAVPFPEQIRYSPCNNYQVVFGTMLGLQKEGEKTWFSSMGQSIEHPLGANNKAPSDQLQCLGTNIGIRKSPPVENLRANYWIPRGSERLMETSYGIRLTHTDVPSEPEIRRENGPTQSFDMDNTMEGTNYFLDSHSDIQLSAFSSDVASSSPSTIRKIEDHDDTRNTIDESSSESFLELYTNEDVTNTLSTSSRSCKIYCYSLNLLSGQVETFKTCAAELPVQAEAVRDKFEEHHIADILVSSLDPINNSIPFVDIPEYARGILRASSLKWDELMTRFQSSDQLQDASTFNELKLLTNQLPGGEILFDCVKEVFRVVYQNFCRFVKPDVKAYIVKRNLFNEVIELFEMHYLQHPSGPSPTTLEQLVEKDITRRKSWLNIQNDTEDIAIEMEEDLLQKLIMEIVSEMCISEA